MKEFIKCKRDDCANPKKTLGLCNTHYKLFNKGRTELKFIRLANNTPIEKRLNSMSRFNSENGCIEWIRCIGTRNGYGYLTIDGKKKSAHIISWEFHNNKSAKGLVIRHKCDNRKCINKDHLISGTQADNIADAVSRNRNVKGTNCKNAKLNNDIIVKIRQMIADSYKQTSIAELFDVTPSVISNIKHGKRWKHIRTSLCPCLIL
jgi:predicted XRE-type DNA-binding protein